MWRWENHRVKFTAPRGPEVESELPHWDGFAVGDRHRERGLPVDVADSS